MTKIEIIKGFITEIEGVEETEAGYRQDPNFALIQMNFWFPQGKDFLGVLAGDRMVHVTLSGKMQLNDGRQPLEGEESWSKTLQGHLTTGDNLVMMAEMNAEIRRILGLYRFLLVTIQQGQVSTPFVLSR